MAKRPIPHEMTDAWLHPLFIRRGVRRDLAKYLRSAKEGDMLAAADGLRAFDRLRWCGRRRIG